MVCLFFGWWGERGGGGGGGGWGSGLRIEALCNPRGTWPLIAQRLHMRVSRKDSIGVMLKEL